MGNSSMSFDFKKLLLYLIIFSLPIGTKKFLYSFSLPFKLPISYGSAFLYVLDIFVLLFIFLNIKRIHFKKISIFAFLGLVFLSVIFSYNFPLALYSFIHLILFSLFSLILADFLKRKDVDLKDIFSVVGVSAFLEAVVGILQFRNQASLGLKILGESVLGPMTEGVARTSTEFGNFLRVYGTMPHANILAAFLVLGFAGLTYVFMKSRNKFVLAPMFVIFSGLFLTFSRSGWIIFIFFASALLVYGLLSKNLRSRAFLLVGAVVSFVIFLVLIFGSLTTARSSFSTTEPSVTYRIDYDLIALNLIRSHPWLGVGAGNEIIGGLRGGFYQKEGLTESWQWQPIHNIYLLIASDAGLLGLASFLVFLWSVFYPLMNSFWRERKNELGLDLFFPLILGLGWLFFGLVDHFFWDLESGSLMFWTTLGIMMGVCPRSSTDRAQASEA